MSNQRFLTIPVNQLRIGMYVVELDRPWLDSPFLVQGFVIKSVEELDVLMNLCSQVTIDTGQSRVDTKPIRHQRPGRTLNRERLQETLNVRVSPHRDTTTFDAELASARHVYSDFERMVGRLYEGMRSHRTLDVKEVRKPVSAIVDSIIRNPDACMLLGKLRRKGDYTYNHALGSSVWAAAFGRQLGLPRPVILNLATGALLADVGKVQLSDRLLAKPDRLTPEEIEQVRGHVVEGEHILRHTRGVDNIALQMVRFHHERHSGRGYPRGLKGNDIPVYGRIAGIVDTYDALINDKPYAPAMSASEAIKVLYDVRDVDFQAELVEEFIQAVGIYPAGSLVELSNGQVGVVVAEYRRRRLRPRVLILLDGDKRPLAERRYLDLYEVTHDEAGHPLEIRRSLHDGEYGIAMDDILV